MSTTAAQVLTRTNIRFPADGRDELLFVPLWGQVVECCSPLDAAIIAEIGKSFSSVDFGRLQPLQLEQLIAECVPHHLEAVGAAIRRRAAELRALLNDGA